MNKLFLVFFPDYKIPISIVHIFAALCSVFEYIVCFFLLSFDFYPFIYFIIFLTEKKINCFFKEK